MSLPSTSSVWVCEPQVAAAVFQDCHLGLRQKPLPV